MYKIGIVILVCFTLLSCKQGKKQRYVYDHTLSFDVYSSSYWSGYVAEEDFFYTTNLATRSMRFYDSKGKELNRFSFNDIIAPNTTGFQVKVLSSKEVYLLDYANHFIYRLNSVGNILKTINTQSYIKDKSMEAYFTNDINGIEEETILLDLSFKDTLNRGDRELRWLGSKKKSVSGKIEGVNLNPEFVYSTITPEYLIDKGGKNQEEHFSTYTSSILYKDLVLFAERFSNLIYVLDRATLEVKKTIPIISQYTDTAIENFTFYTPEKAKTINFTDYNYEYATQVNQIVYDPYRDTVLVVLAHRAAVDKDPEQKYTNRPFSIITYDKEFHVIDEQVFFNRKYDFYKTIFPTKEGLLIHSNSKMSPTYKPNTLSYDLFKI